MRRCGLLVHSVCLLSTSGKEEGMLDDFAGAYRDLDVSLRFSVMDDRVEGGSDLVVLGMASASSVNTSSLSSGSISSSISSTKPQRYVRESIDCLLENYSSPTVAASVGITNLDDEESAMGVAINPPAAGNNDFLPPPGHESISPPPSNYSSDFSCALMNISRVTVRVGVSRDVWAWIVSELSATSETAVSNSYDIKVVPVLFNLGVNEMQTLANKGGSTSMQTEINRQGAADLRAYYDSAYAATNLSSGTTTLNTRPSSTSTFKSFDLRKVADLLYILDELVEAEARDKMKLVLFSYLHN